MQRVARVSWPLVAAILISGVGVAVAQPPENVTPPEGFTFVLGGEPGIHVLLEGADVAQASSLHDAFRIDPARPVNVTFSFHPPPNVTWELREIRLGLLVNGPSSEPPETLTKKEAFNATLPPTGSTVFVNRTVDLGPVKPVGAGLFLMKVDIIDDTGVAIYAGTFFVHVTGNIFLTVAGATVTVVSVATGYGLWRIVKDIREMYEARQRHKKREAETKAAKAKHWVVQASHITGGVSGFLSIAASANSEASHLEKRGVVAWTATGLGLGGVSISWLQFLGYVPLNLGATLATAASVGGAFLTSVILAIGVQKRIASKREKKMKEEEATRTIVPEGPPVSLPIDEPTRDINQKGQRPPGGR